MAEGEKTEKATPKKRNDERKKGNVFKSQDAIAVAALLGSFGMLWIWIDNFPRELGSFMTYCLENVKKSGTTLPVFISELAVEGLMVVAKTAGPILLVTMLCAVVATFTQTKFLVNMATFVAGALAGVRPEVMGIGPVASTKKVLAKTGMKIEDFDIIEANEAFAAQSVAVGKELGIDVDKQLNPNGGAIALGHPVGASGCRILVTLLHEMQAKGAKTGLATLCIGGGMGCSTIVKIED